MKHAWQVVLRELRAAVAPFVFFFAVFVLLALTKTLMLEEYTVTSFGLALAAIGALTVAKAVLIADSLPALNRFAGRPLIHAIFWKSLVFGAFCLLFRGLEELIPLAVKYGSLRQGAGQLLAEVSWPHFWALQMWLTVALVSYTTILEMSDHLGKGVLRKALLG